MAVFNINAIMAAYFGIICSIADDFTACYEGTCYIKSDTTMNWANAVIYCNEIDAVLVSIHSSEENAFIQNYAQCSDDDACWIGMSDDDNEGIWQWIDGTPADYLNWDSDEPNNFDGNEHWAEIIYNGKWNDDYSYQENFALCMTPAPTSSPTLSPTVSPTLSPSLAPDFLTCYEGTCYQKSRTTLNWTNAVIYCNQIDAVLVSIHSSMENTLIQNYAQCGDDVPCWIGMSDDNNEGTMQWIDGTPVDYLNFALNQPDNTGGGEHWVEIWGDGEWNDNVLYNENFALCMRPAPTSHPTLAPVLAISDFIIIVSAVNVTSICVCFIIFALCFWVLRRQVNAESHRLSRTGDSEHAAGEPVKSYEGIEITRVTEENDEVL